MSNPQGPVSAIVVTHDSAAVLPDCLVALSREGAAVVVVDNKSTDNSVRIALDCGAQVIPNHSNQGYGRSNNIGVQAAGTELCLIVNPDVVVQPGSIAALVKAASEHPEAAVFGPRLLEPDGRVFFHAGSVLEEPTDARRAKNRALDHDCEVVVLSGAALLVRRSVFIMLGGFDSSIFLFYEDDDFCYRARAAGHRLRYVPAATANHLRGKSSVQTLANVQRTRFHQAWSRVYVCRKHGKRSNVAVLLPTYVLKYAVSTLCGDPFRRARYASSVLGTWAALRGETALAREGLLDADGLATTRSPQR